MKERIITKKDLTKTARLIVEKISNNKNEKAVILAISGDLGTGKTTITQEIAKILGIKESLVSPTFVIMKKYDIKNGAFKKLIHIDAYRLEKEAELIHLGWEELISDKDNLIIIEWPERIVNSLKKENAHFVYLEHIDDKTRKLKI
jgi:tRNA threonylcarbamoyladenosine biosynthesis protein TsaE